MSVQATFRKVVKNSDRPLIIQIGLQFLVTMGVLGGSAALWRHDIAIINARQAQVSAAADNDNPIVCELKDSKVIFSSFPKETDVRPEARYARLGLANGFCSLP